jgi:hypothetical protein
MSKFEHVIIVTYGRSGSTLLQGLLNAIPGYLVRGENYNFAYKLYLAWKCLADGGALEYTANSSIPSHPWYGIREIDKNLLFRNFYKILKDALVPEQRRATTKCFGFKEIRYTDILPEFNNYLTFLRAVMPNLGIVVITRNHDEVAKSGWWANSPKDKVTKLLRESDAAFSSYVAAHPDHAFLITYQDVTSISPQVRALFEFLDEDYSIETIKRVLETKHSSVTMGKRKAATTDELKQTKS